MVNRGGAQRVGCWNRRQREGRATPGSRTTSEYFSVFFYEGRYKSGFITVEKLGWNGERKRVTFKATM